MCKKLLNDFIQVYIIIDALDECTAYDQLFEVIGSILEWQMSKCHLLVTSRREEKILATIQEWAPVEMLLSADLIESDIILYTQFAVGNTQKLGSYCSRTS